MAKLQVIMERKMTGIFIALLAAVIIIVLVVYSFGLMNSRAESTECLTQPGFRCQGLVYSNSTGDITATLVQVTQNTWISANIIAIEWNGYSGETPNASYFISGKDAVATNIGDNQPDTVAMPLLSQQGHVIGRVPPAYQTSAEIWAQYTTASGGPYYVMMAKALATAV
jgi:hypothetical protein